MYQTAQTHILVVDDEPVMRDLLRDFLVSQGYRVECHTSGNGALKALAADPSIAAVVSHIRMSPMNGFELLEQIKNQYPAMPVVLFTGEGSSDEHQHALKSGAANYLTKPFALSRLSEALRVALAAGKASNP